MVKRRTPYAIAAVAVSLGLLAACSDEGDRTPEAPAEQVTPVPATPPAATVPSTPPADTTPPAAAPGASSTPGNTMPPPREETTPPMGGSSSGGTAPMDTAPGTTSPSS